MSQNYSVRLRCPYGDMDAWVVFEDRNESLEDVLGASWTFECETHGVQREIPMEAKAVGPVIPSVRSGASVHPVPSAAEAYAGLPGTKASAPAGPSANGSGQPPSEDEDLRVPVVIYGWSKHHGTFHEETTTLQANASGALVPLNTKLEIGETCFVLNKAAHKEKEIRVVHVAEEPGCQTRVGIAFMRPDTDFWKATRKEPRITATHRVQVSGKDNNANHFAQTAYTVDVSSNGARLNGVSCLTRPGEIIEVKRRWHGKARYRVVWVGQIGLEHANQIGVCCLEPEKNIWGVLLPENDAEEATEDSTAVKKNSDS